MVGLESERGRRRQKSSSGVEPLPLLANERRELMVQMQSLGIFKPGTKINLTVESIRVGRAVPHRQGQPAAIGRFMLQLLLGAVGSLIRVPSSQYVGPVMGHKCAESRTHQLLGGLRRLIAAKKGLTAIAEGLFAATRTSRHLGNSWHCRCADYRGQLAKQQSVLPQNLGMRCTAEPVAAPPSILPVSRTIPAGMGSCLGLRME